MNLIEETYRVIDSEGIQNVAFVDDEKKASLGGNGIVLKEKKGENPSDT